MRLHLAHVLVTVMPEVQVVRTHDFVLRVVAIDS